MYVCVRASVCACVRVCVCVCGGGGRDCDVNVFRIFRHWLFGAPRYDPGASGINNLHHQSLTIGLYLIFERERVFEPSVMSKFECTSSATQRTLGSGSLMPRLKLCYSHMLYDTNLHGVAHSQVPTTNHYPHERIYCNPNNEVNSAPILELSTRNHCTILPKIPFLWIHWAVTRVVYGGGNTGNLPYSIQAHAL